MLRSIACAIPKQRLLGVISSQHMMSNIPSKSNIIFTKSMSNNRPVLSSLVLDTKVIISKRYIDTFNGSLPMKTGLDVSPPKRWLTVVKSASNDKPIKAHMKALLYCGYSAFIVTPFMFAMQMIVAFIMICMTAGFLALTCFILEFLGRLIGLLFFRE